MGRRKGTEAVAHLALVLAGLGLTACASTSGTPAALDDPLETVNRPVFSFNDGLDRQILEPVARGWEAITPHSVVVHIDQFFENLQTPGYFVNDLLQGDVRQSGVEMFRFLLNSTVGLAGLFDPASHYLGLESRDEDFGQTLGVWGVPSGPYLMLPVAGSYAARDLAAAPVDLALNAWTLVPGVGLVYTINRRSLRIEEFREARGAALDLYVFLRDSYQQSREAAVMNSDSPEEAPSDDFYELDEDP